MQLENVCADVTKGISDIGKKLRHMENVPHDVNHASRDVEENVMHVSDVLLHVGPATHELRENPFEPLFSPPDMHEEKKDVHSSVPEVHPPAILHTFSAFVLKRRVAVRTSAGVVQDDVPAVLSAATDVENGAEGDDADAGIHIQPKVRVIPSETLVIPSEARDLEVAPPSATNPTTTRTRTRPPKSAVQAAVVAVIAFMAGSLLGYRA
jgi:hypothetical protein